jgi:hypothetical protein
MGKINYALFFMGWIIFSFTSLISCGADDQVLDEKDNDKESAEEVVVPLVNDLVVEKTGKANELQATWTYPSGAVSVEISFLLESADGASAVNNNIRRTTGDKGSFLIKVSEHGTYIVSAVAINNYGERSEKVTVKASPMYLPLMYVRG